MMSKLEVVMILRLKIWYAHPAVMLIANFLGVLWNIYEGGEMKGQALVMYYVCCARRISDRVQAIMRNKSSE